jgi:hypothetical protein
MVGGWLMQRGCGLKVGNTQNLSGGIPLPTLYPFHPCSSQPPPPLFHGEKAPKTTAKATFNALFKAKPRVRQAKLLLFVQFYLALEYASFIISLWLPIWKGEPSFLRPA